MCASLHSNLQLAQSGCLVIKSTPPRAFSSPDSQTQLFPLGVCHHMRTKPNWSSHPNWTSHPRKWHSPNVPNQKSRNILGISHLEDPLHLQVLPILLQPDVVANGYYPSSAEARGWKDCLKIRATLCYIESSRLLRDTWWGSILEIKYKHCPVPVSSQHGGSFPT